MSEEGTSLYAFTPTEELLLDVLAARTRLGEKIWTFQSRQGTALQLLADKGLVFKMHGVTDGTIRAGLTDKGKAQTLSADYSPPAFAEFAAEIKRLERRLDEATTPEPWRGDWGCVG